ncbi:hypothetical protein LF41_1011 [Lysobacter dokdonensis DS-58]|uniref:Uncharacterized protein n=1 Tax=Lysobacter dokdonensis DS-58 TaxID=1300345 RepID=A0A0A2X5D6_9GAMM|nr:hypothetical protein [Lysobacter dokdonensis]KGQ20474.1 hypothetical protein LF41_1011 [Lysobacter dokdonensis DS-58]
MTNRLRRRLRVIAARATLCVVLVAAMGATGFRTASEVQDAEATQQASVFSR